MLCGFEGIQIRHQTVFERYKQFGTVLMKGRTTEQIAGDCACWCRQVPSKSGVWTTRGDAHDVVDMRYSVSVTTSCGHE